MDKYETIKQLIVVWEAAKTMAGPYRLRAENYADGYADGLKAALALFFGRYLRSNMPEGKTAVRLA